MRQRVTPAVFLGEKADRYYCVEVTFDDDVPSEKAMNEKDRLIEACKRLIVALEKDEAIFFMIPDKEEEEAEIGWEQSAKDTEKRSKE